MLQLARRYRFDRFVFGWGRWRTVSPWLQLLRDLYRSGRQVSSGKSVEAGLTSEMDCEARSEAKNTLHLLGLMTIGLGVGSEVTGENGERYVAAPCPIRQSKFVKTLCE